MSSKVDEVLKKLEDLEREKEEAIQALLAERQRIDDALAKLGYKQTRRGRPPGSKNKAAGKTSSK